MKFYTWDKKRKIYENKNRKRAKKFPKKILQKNRLKSLDRGKYSRAHKIMVRYYITDKIKQRHEKNPPDKV